MWFCRIYAETSMDGSTKEQGSFKENGNGKSAKTLNHEKSDEIPGIRKVWKS